jgi:hypothetical protein
MPGLAASAAQRSRAGRHHVIFRSQFYDNGR